MASTTTTLNDLLPQITAEAMFVANERSIMRGLVKGYNIPAGQGKTITVPIYNTVAAAGVTEGSQVGEVNVSTNGETLTITTAGVRTLITDLARTSAASNVVADIGRLFGEAIAKKMDQDLIALFAGFGTDVGDDDANLSAATIAKAVATLRGRSVPSDAIAVVVNPFAAYDLKATMTNTFANPNAGVIQNAAMEEGYIGMLFGVPVFESANVAEVAGVSVGGVFHRDALGLAMVGDMSIETQRQATYLGDDIVAAAHYGVGALQGTYGVKVSALSSLYVAP